MVSYRHTCFLAAVISFVLALKYVVVSHYVLMQAPINSDAGYFLSLARDIHDGNKLYNQVDSIYTPLTHYLSAQLFHVVSRFDDPFLVPCLFNLLLITACSFLVYLCLRQERLPHSLSMFAGVLNYALVLKVEGDGYFLEPPTALFALLALLFCRRQELRDSKSAAFLSGLFSSASFLCKQYGLAFMLATVVCHAKSYSGRRKIPILLFGQVFPVLCAYVYFQPGIDLSLLFNPPQFSIPAPQFSNMRRVFFELFPSALLLVAAVIARPSYLKSSLLSSALLFALLVFPSLLRRAFFHYYILILPFVIVAAFMFVHLQRRRRVVAVVALLVLTVSTIRSLWNDPLAWSYDMPRGEQLELANRIAKYIPPVSKVMLVADPWLTYPLNLLPTETGKRLFLNGFLDRYSTPELIQLTKQSDWLVVDVDPNSPYTLPFERFERSHVDWAALVKESGFERRALIDQRYEVWQKIG